MKHLTFERTTDNNVKLIALFKEENLFASINEFPKRYIKQTYLQKVI